jgi:hypothetical protein
MAGDFDDHPTVVVLEDVVRRLVQIDVISAPDRQKRLDDWLVFLKGRGALFRQAAIAEIKNNNAKISSNAMRIASAFDEFGEKLTDRS